MNKNVVYFTGLAMLVAAMLLAGCKSAEVEVPFSKFKTDKKYLRAVGVGVSQDFAIAKKIALQNGKAELAENIQSVINQVNTSYFEQYGVGATPDLSQKIEGMTQNIASQVLSNVKIVDQKLLNIKKTNSVRCFVAIEMAKEDIGLAVMSGISEVKKQQIDIDEEKYRKIFNEALGD
jgi:hypothetical protein